jgi:hypothetical protein
MQGMGNEGVPGHTVNFNDVFQISTFPGQFNLYLLI